MVLDEWDSAESFNKFFENNTDIPAIMQEMGLRRLPTSRSGTSSTRATIF